MSLFIYMTFYKIKLNMQLLNFLHVKLNNDGIIIIN